MRLRSVKLVVPIVAVIILLEIAIFSRDHIGRSDLHTIDQNDRPLRLLTKQENLRELIPPKNELNNKRWLTIAIPTVERQKRNYFLTMIDSMLNNTQINQLNSIYVVVFLADVNNTKWKDDMEMVLKRKYSYLFEIGTLKIIRAPVEIYSELDSSFDKANKSYWHMKQNYDYAFMMRYSQNMSKYYLQMEDDVITAEGYIDAIKDFIEQQNGDKWICLEFSELGFIGKLYRNRDLYELAQYLLMFKKNRPVDINNSHFNVAKGQILRRARLPTLFQHIGYHSSLPNRIQPLTDRFFQENFVVYSNIGVVCVVALGVVVLFLTFNKYFKWDVRKGAFWTKHRIRFS